MDPPRRSAKNGPNKEGICQPLVSDPTPKPPKRSQMPKPQKMYISSSMGDMCRRVIRMGCKENSLGLTSDPAPAKFYDFWHKYSVSTKEKIPSKYVDLRKVSVPRLNMIDEEHNYAFDVRVTSSKTNEVEKLVESDDEDLVKGKGASSASLLVDGQKRRNDGRGQSFDPFALKSKHLLRTEPNSKHVNIHTPVSHQNLKIREKMDVRAVAASMLRNINLEEQRMAMEIALKGDQYGTVIEDFVDELDDPFLVDVLEFERLPDKTCTPEFDYFNEDPAYREKERAKKQLEADKALLKLRMKDSKIKKKPKLSEVIFESSESEDEDGEQKMVSIVTPADNPIDDSHENYQTCLIRQKKRVEDNIRAAVRCRSPMGSYKVPRGELPLARTFAFSTPGPAAYYPKLNAVKPNPIGIFLTKRWTKSIYETAGPGPASYIPTCKCTAQMLTLHEAPRFEESESIGPGPGKYNLSEFGGTAKDKPHALILSRRPTHKIGCGSSKLVNVYGISRVGKANPPKALIISRHLPKDKSLLGPGAYDPYSAKDTKVGISLKGRFHDAEVQDSPGFVDLPPFTSPGISFGIRKFETLHSDSPGPIYQLPPPARKPLTMTFRPFPMPGREADPSPVEYGIKPGDQAIKFYTTAPRAVLCGSHNLNYGIGNTPGPNKYKIKDCKCKEGIKMKGRTTDKVDVLPGPADYLVGSTHFPLPPRAVFQIKKDKPVKDSSPGFYDINLNHKIIGGLMSPRWHIRNEDDRGPQFYDLFGLTHRGKYSKIPLSLKSRHSPFVFTHLSENAKISKGTTC